MQKTPESKPSAAQDTASGSSPDSDFLLQKALSILSRDEPPPNKRLSMYIYDATHMPVDDEPDAQLPFAIGPTESAENVLRRVRELVSREFSVERCFLRQLRSRGRLPMRRKDRRRTSSLLEWEPELVFKTFVAAKPTFFDSSDYKDHVPQRLCFGKINMRSAKAWARGPNRRKLPSRPTLLGMVQCSFCSGFKKVRRASDSTIESSEEDLDTPSCRCARENERPLPYLTQSLEDNLSFYQEHSQTLQTLPLPRVEAHIKQAQLQASCHQTQQSAPVQHQQMVKCLFSGQLVPLGGCAHTVCQNQSSQLQTLFASLESPAPKAVVADEADLMFEEFIEADPKELS